MFPSFFIKLELVFMIVLLSGMRSYFYCSRLENYNNQIKKVTLKVLLVEFKDVKHRNPKYPAALGLPAYTFEDFSNLFFSENVYVSPNMYSPDGKEVFGSFRDYYRVMSNNNLLIEGLVVNEDEDNDNVPDWISLDREKSYYHNYNGEIFRIEAIEKALDNNLDIKVDDNTFLAIIYAGHTYRKKTGTLNPEAFYDERTYIMGERFAAGSPYEEERDDPILNSISHFAHIGIHVHEFFHLLGFKDLYDYADNKSWGLMSSGNYNGPNNEGACPAPLNPFFRHRMNWITLNTIFESYTAFMEYGLKKPEIFLLQNRTAPYDFFLIEYRNFNSSMNLGEYSVSDYNSYIKHNSVEEGILIWRKLTGDYVKLLHSSGEDCEQGDDIIFPGNNNVRVITPWSDSRECRKGFYYYPNTKPGTNCGIEIINSESNNFILELYQKFPISTSPSKPKYLQDKTDYFVKMEWEQNIEPDLAYYKVYKKYSNTEYTLYDSTKFNSYTDYNEKPSSDTMNFEYAYYKITSFDSEYKESIFSHEIKIPVESKQGKITDFKKDELMASDFTLSQNYPNPFNPNTIINYSIAKRCNVILKVFDVIGREIKTVINKEQLKGDYEVEFNGKNLSSGTYFYRLQAGDFVEIKKMILMK